MKLRKGAGALLLSVILMMGMMPGQAFAAEEQDAQETETAEEVQEPAEESLQGFVRDDKGTLYYNKAGEKVKGWKTIDGRRYHFGTGGYMSVGVKKIGSYYYYFNPVKKDASYGAKKTGWKKYKGKKYFFSSRKYGRALTGWRTIDGHRYYFSKKYANAYTGWHKIGTYTYHFTSAGRMQTGWHKIGSYQYHFTKAGRLQRDKMISKNKYVNSRGRLVKKSKIYANQKEGLSGLKKKLRKKIGEYHGTWCIYVKNLDTNRYLCINNKTMHPASMIKLFNMGCTYERIHKGKMKKTDTVRSNLRQMITVSSNDGYNYLIKRNGGGSYSRGVSRINSFCERHGYSDTSCGGTLAPTYYSSYHKGSTRSSVRDCGHILEDIYRGTLVSSSCSKEMLSLLKKQKRTSKIPAGLPEGVKSANKTGEVGSEQHDSAIVFSRGADYIIVVMTQGDGNAISHIRSVSKTVYNYFN